CQQAYSNPFTF
nr:immunoglobulin light chain junction region [Macaca mulatta]MOW39569.1 immunoglobulin light chain junction region [Macaca mulatta]MOW39597.1 immunoglobulin light chain junction region [Macaca mulatta]MOW39621.1 immunoglobulin light chain junction region [Macaca mulatta]MOW39696.1 immunoglobulin light chain junction region [Macaca mulatta]